MTKSPHYLLKIAILYILIAKMSGCQTSYELPNPLEDSYAIVINKVNTVKNQDTLNLKISNCETYPGGNSQLLNEMAHAVSSGLVCLKKWGQNSDAERLAAIFDNRIKQRPVTITCGVVGQSSIIGLAFESTSPYYPGFTINSLSSESLSRDNDQYRQGFLFHELLHNLKYYHSVTFDLPELAQRCCFDSKSAKNEVPQEDRPACLLMRDRPSYGSVEYIARFANKNLDVDRNLVIQTALAAAIAAKDGQAIAVMASEVFDQGRDPYKGIIHRKIAKKSTKASLAEYDKKNDLKNLDRYLSQYETWPASEAMAEALSDVLASMIMGDWDEVDKNVTLLHKKSEIQCPKINESHRSDLNQTFGLTGILFYTANLAPEDRLIKWMEKPVCSMK